MRSGTRSRMLRIGALLVALIAGPAVRLGAQGVLSAIETDVDKIVRTARPSVVTLVARDPGARGATRIGSGVAIADDEVLTTASVVGRASHVWVRTANRLQFDAVPIGADPISNLALLKVLDARLPALQYATSRPPRVGDWVIALGTSRDNPDHFGSSLGNITFHHRDPRLPLMQLTNVVYPGFSGAAVVNAHGEVVGIRQGDLDPDSREQLPPTERPPSGTSFMLPVESAEPIALMLERQGRVHDGYLGVSAHAVSVESETARGLRIPLGVQVEDVTPGSPAARVGLRSGDLVVAFEGVPVEYPTQLARWVAASPPGTAVRLVWVRDE